MIAMIANANGAMDADADDACIGALVHWWLCLRDEGG